MSDKRPHVVWILGSGFSKSLGGPLLADLLSHRGKATVEKKFPSIANEQVYQIFWRHLKDSHEARTKGLPVYWDHAEEFLDFVDSAQRDVNRTRYKILADLVSPGYAPSAKDELESFRKAARQLIAAECRFAEHLSGEIEGIEPYVRWGTSLNERDTIVTFNYDLVLETLGNARQGMACGPSTVATVRDADEVDIMQGIGCANILKLHGSVDWEKSGDRIGPRSDSVLPDEPFIAMPGPGKYNACRGPLKPLWSLAVKRLKEADVVVFLGYRFPPSDSQSLGAILGAIRENQQPHLRMHTVLGPRVNDDDTVRLVKLLEHSARAGIRFKPNEPGAVSGRRFALVAQPLYVQDFLTVLHDRELYGYN